MKSPLALGILVILPALAFGQIWTYNFGPNKLMQRIRFRDGIVSRIDSLGYGF